MTDDVTTLVQREQPANAPALTTAQHSVSELQVMARAMAGAGMVKGRDPEANALALLLLAQATGTHPMQAALDFHIIEGKPSLTKDAMLARFYAAGGAVEWTERTDERVAAIFRLPGREDVAIDWNTARAKQAGLVGKDNFRKYPRQMLTARVISEGVRIQAPHIVGGLYTPEELHDLPPRIIENAATYDVQPDPDRDFSIGAAGAILTGTPEDLAVYMEQTAKLADAFGEPTVREGVSNAANKRLHDGQPPLTSAGLAKFINAFRAHLEGEYPEAVAEEAAPDVIDLDELDETTNETTDGGLEA